MSNGAPSQQQMGSALAETIIDSQVADQLSQACPSYISMVQHSPVFPLFLAELRTSASSICSRRQPFNMQAYITNDMRLGLECSIATAQSNVNTSLGQLANNVTSSHSEFSRQMEQRISTVETTQLQNGARLDKVDQQLAQIREELRLRQLVRPGSSTFDRQIDTPIVAVRAQALVSQAAVEQGLAGWLKDCNIGGGEWKFDESDPTSQKYTLRFKGDKHVAARKVSQVLGALKISSPGDRGSPRWRSCTAESIAGGPAALFAGPGKSICQIKRELGTKKARTLLQDLHPLFADKFNGEVLAGGKPILKICPIEGQEIPELQFADDNIAPEQMAPARIRQATADGFGTQTETR
ncbi:unnamed protein product, partial [Prorocentrum cordatum]